MAQRQREGLFYKQLTLEEVAQPGGVQVADHAQVELEMRELFENLEEGDPTGSTVKNGNFGNQVIIPFTSPTAIDTEKAIEHNLGKLPKGWRPIAPAVAGGSMCGSLYFIRDPDLVNCYVAVRAASDVNRLTAIVVY